LHLFDSIFIKDEESTLKDHTKETLKVFEFDMVTKALLDSMQNFNFLDKEATNLLLRYLVWFTHI
jgi:hypothetical protein